MLTDALVTDGEGGEGEKGYYNTKLLHPIVHQFKEFRSDERKIIFPIWMFGIWFINVFKKPENTKINKTRKIFNDNFQNNLLCLIYTL